MASPDRSTELVAIIWVFTTLAIITVTVKLFTRVHILHSPGWDDFFIFFSMALEIICTALFTYDVHLGMGKHAAAIVAESGPAQLSKAVKFNLIANPFGIMAYSLPNISVAILLDRLLTPNRLRSRALYGLAISQCIIAGISCVLLFTQCLPTEYLWNPDPELHPKCFKSGTMTGYSYFVGSYTAATDIILAAVPIAAFWTLQLKLKTKIGLCLMMGCTLLAAICAIVKTTKLYQLANLADFTYGTVDLIIWAIVEGNVIIIAACVPTLRPFFHRAFNREEVTEGRSFFRGGIFSFGSGSFLGLKRSQGSSVSVTPFGINDAEIQDSKQRSSDSQQAITRTTQFEMDWEDSPGTRNI